MKELNQKRMQILKPVLIMVALLIVLIVLIETGYVKIDRVWFVFPLAGIRISTVVTVFACFGLVLFLQRTNTLKSIYYAVLATIFSMGLFEIMWYYSAAAYRGWDLEIFEFAALSGWVFLGIREVIHRRPPKISIILYGVFIATFVLWIATGFQFNDLSYSKFSISAEILNVTSKGELFFAYALHIGSVKPTNN